MLLISVRTIVDVKVVGCSGCLRKGSESATLEEFVTGLLRANHHVVLDLTGVDHIDSSGLNTLSNICELASSVGCEVRIVNPEKCPDDVLGLSDSYSSSVRHRGLA